MDTNNGWSSQKWAILCFAVFQIWVAGAGPHPSFSRLESSKRGQIIYTYQAKDITFEEWINELTLCLAPLIAHIIAGVPNPVYRQEHKPSWHERIIHYNPTSILWRYFALTDRRFRAKFWNAEDMAASNALFWTANNKWDGSEKIMIQSRKFIECQPKRTHVDFFSMSAVKTIIITMQGVQAIYAIGIGVTPNHDYCKVISLDNIFSLLAIIGLFRLPAAFWLMDENTYKDIGESDYMERKSGTPWRKRQNRKRNRPQKDSKTDSFHAPNSLRGILIRTTCMIFLLMNWLTCILYMSPLFPRRIFTATSFMLNLFFLIFLTATVLTWGYYFCRSQATTTVLPCISSIWYKLYTMGLVLMVVLLIVFASLETRRTACGKFTTWPYEVDDCLICYAKSGCTMLQVGA